MINEISSIQSKAFNVASSIPAEVYQEAQVEIDRLMETGASFREAKPALRRVVRLLSANRKAER